MQGGAFLFFVLPRLASLSQTMGTPQPLSSYVYAVLMVLLGAGGMGLGILQFQSKHRYFRYAVLFLILGFLVISFFASQMITASLGSINTETGF